MQWKTVFSHWLICWLATLSPVLSFLELPNLWWPDIWHPFHPSSFIPGKSLLHHGPPYKMGKRLGGTTKTYYNRSTFETKTLPKHASWQNFPGRDQKLIYIFSSMSLLHKPSPLVGCPNHLAQLALVASLPDIATSMSRLSSASE